MMTITTQHRHKEHVLCQDTALRITEETPPPPNQKGSRGGGGGHRPGTWTQERIQAAAQVERPQGLGPRGLCSPHESGGRAAGRGPSPSATGVAGQEEEEEGLRLASARSKGATRKKGKGRGTGRGPGGQGDRGGRGQGHIVRATCPCRPGNRASPPFPLPTCTPDLPRATDTAFPAPLPRVGMGARAQHRVIPPGPPQTLASSPTLPFSPTKANTHSRNEEGAHHPPTRPPLSAPTPTTRRASTHPCKCFPFRRAQPPAPRQRLLAGLPKSASSMLVT
ncbi:WAS/WASL-interacting protein family member 1-like [Penaeus monodon]|uniref:WAS/WASL-interacting protein family member 1-like n=1 Tax=Penaeus monodon TaxID=6687 RepID=UPI0018A71788|nr:WAS/WASL-interacting protein family member 1-like [Penaeus monodon]